METLLVHVEPYISAHTLYLHTCPNVFLQYDTKLYYWDYYTISLHRGVTTIITVTGGRYLPYKRVQGQIFLYLIRRNASLLSQKTGAITDLVSLWQPSHLFDV